MKTLEVALIGAGQGGLALLDMFYKDPLVRIVGVADTNRTAPGIKLARKLKIPVVSDYRKLLDQKKLDLVIDVTGKKEVEKALAKSKSDGFEVMGGTSAYFMWQLIEAKIKSKEEIERLLYEYQSLYDLGLKVTSTDQLDRLYNLIVDYAVRLTNTPAGSIAVFDEKPGEMHLGAAKGFSRTFSKNVRWKIRKAGLTSSILNQKNPLVIPDVKKHLTLDNPVMLQEGIRSLMAAPLWAEGRIMGILYVDDFTVRDFKPREISLLSLLSTIAAMAIDKTRMLESTRMLAITDELTGLYNHRYFLQQLTNEINRSKRYNRPLSLLMLDIDNFKNYNDTFGHLKGNEVLKDLSGLIKDLSREVDVPARYGGEEFTIIMPETNRRRGAALAERLRNKIAGHPFKHREKQPGGRLTVSIGLATYPENASTALSLIEASDKALYEAKRGGRNMVCVSSRKADA
jgi:diguanylate cyclase (GGDEF)-like protein